MHLIVAINPQAAFGKHGEVGDDVVRALRADGHRVTALREDDFATLEAATARAIDQRPDGLVAVGGDGMVSLAVNVLAGSQIPLGIVAAGTGNDMARGLGLPHSRPLDGLRVLQAQLALPPRTIDLARVRAGSVERWYGGVLSAGFDALVNERANRMSWPKGPSRYTLALLAELFGLRSRRYSLSIDGVERQVDAVLVAAGNNVSLGGGMKLTARAQLDDGELDILIGHRLGRMRLIAVFPKVFSGRHLDHPNVEYLRAKRIRIAADESVPAYADGERVGELPVEIEVVPGALRVFAPAPR